MYTIQGNLRDFRRVTKLSLTDSMWGENTNWSLEFNYTDCNIVSTDWFESNTKGQIY
jgi:hypothetical protein